MPEMKDETLPDEEGMARYGLTLSYCLSLHTHASLPKERKKKREENPVLLFFHICLSWQKLVNVCQLETMCLRALGCRPGVVGALEEFKCSVYGDNYDEESELVGNGKASETSKKRKAIAENAVKESASYDWSELADNGKVMLKVYLFSCFNPVASSGPKKKKISLCFNFAFSCKSSMWIFIFSMDIFVKKIHVLQLKGLCFAAEGFDGGGVEILLDSTQPSCCWKEGSFDQQDINTHGKMSDLIRFTNNIFFAKSEALCDST